jgi:hypothetical protein
LVYLVPASTVRAFYKHLSPREPRPLSDMHYRFSLTIFSSSSGDTGFSK